MSAITTREAVQRRQSALKVDIPKDDPPFRLGRVGIIAIVGFGVGIAWPHLAGVRLVPTLPNAPGSSSQDLSGAPDDQPRASATASAAIAPPPEKPAAAPDSQPPVVGEAQVASCSDGGARLKDCDSVDFDRVARARIESLEGCEAARNVTGVLSLGFELDFETDRVVRVLSGKSSSLADAERNILVECYRESFAKVSLAGIPHEHRRYSVFYRVELKGAKAVPSTPDDGPQDVTPASGTATVTWNTALVRSAPDREGKVVARVLQGTRVGVTGRSGDWYRVKYDAKGNQGWVFRTSIGM